MLATVLRLFALRPLFSLMIFGVPLLVILAVGLFTIMAFKFLVFVALPIGLVVWLVRRSSSRRTEL